MEAFQHCDQLCSPQQSPHEKLWVPFGPRRGFCAVIVTSQIKMCLKWSTRTERLSAPVQSEYRKALSDLVPLPWVPASSHLHVVGEPRGRQGMNEISSTAPTSAKRQVVRGGKVCRHVILSSF